MTDTQHPLTAEFYARTSASTSTAATSMPTVPTRQIPSWSAMRTPRPCW
jgi:hypothetical protein